MKDERFGMVMTRFEKDVLRRLVAQEGESTAAVVRRLIREEAKRRELCRLEDLRSDKEAQR